LSAPIHRVGRVPFPELAQERLGLLRVDVEVHVEQARAAEGDLVREVDVPAAGLHRDALVVDHPGQIRRRVRVLASLHVDGGTEPADGVDGGR